MPRTRRRELIAELVTAQDMLKVMVRNGMGDWPVAQMLRRKIEKLTGKSPK